MSGAAWRRVVPAGLMLGLLAGPSAAEAPQVAYNAGLLSIRCANAPLATVLEQVKTATGMELIFEGTPGSTRLTADIPAQPVSLALPRLLEGTGVNYLLVADHADPRRVAKMYIGSTATAGTSSGTPSPADRRAARTAPPVAPIQEPTTVLPLPEPPAEQGGDDDDEVSTDVPTTVEAEPAPVPGGEFHPIRDPFGRAIPRNNPGGGPGGGRRGGKSDQ